jgi:hypothetical protein
LMRWSASSLSFLLVPSPALLRVSSRTRNSWVGVASRGFPPPIKLSIGTFYIQIRCWLTQELMQLNSMILFVSRGQHPLFELVKPKEGSCLAWPVRTPLHRA